MDKMKINSPARARLQDTLLPAEVYGAQDGGLGYNDLLGTPDAKVYVTGQTMIFDDVATGELYWGGQLIVVPILITVGTHTPTFVIDGALLAGTRKPGEDGYTGDGEHEIIYRYVYTDGFDESEPVAIRVKCSFPGGEDPDGSTRDINENLVRPTITPNPIPDDPNVSVTVRFPRWKNIAVGDVVTVDWAGYHFTLPAITDPGQVLPFATLRYDDLVRAGGGEHVPVSYYIYDIVHNWSKYAPYADPSVDIDPGTLVAPQIVEAVDNLLDLERLGDQDATVRVGTRPLALHDIVIVYWTGTDAGSGRDEYVTAAQTFEDENVFYLDFAIPHAVAVAAAGGSVAVRYGASLSGVSKTRRYRVGELAEVLLDPPIVPASSNGQIDPFDTDEITVNAPFDAAQMFLGDTVTMYVFGLRGSISRAWEDSVTLSSGDLRDPVPFFCPADVLQSVDNGQATFRYEVTSSALAPYTEFSERTSVRKSDILTLAVRSNGAQPLPAPVVDKLTDGRLDPDTSFTIVHVPSSFATVPGASVTLLWAGIVSYHTTLPVSSLGTPPAFRVLGENIKGNENSDVTVTYAVESRESLQTRFTVSKNAIPPFDIDTSTLTLAVGDSALRQATGGKPPYTYASADSRVASVDTTGRVTAVTIGATTIEASDTAAGRGSYPAVVTRRAKPLAPSVREAINDTIPAELSVAHLIVPAQAGGTTVRVDVAAAVPFTHTLPMNDPAHPPVFDLPGATFIAPNAGGPATATYTVVGYAEESAPYELGILPQALPAPDVAQAVAGQIDPLVAAYGITITIAATPAISTTDDVAVTVAGAGGTETPPAQTGNPLGMSLSVSAAFVAQNLARAITAEYTVTPKAGGTPRKSPVAHFDVLDLQANDSRVGKPTIAEAVAGVVDLSQFTGPATVDVPRWPLMTPGQLYWLTARSGGQLQPVVTAAPVVAVGPLQHALSRTWLDALPDRAPLVIDLDIAFAGGAQATAHTFTSMPYTVREKAAPPAFPAPRVPESSGGTLDGNKTAATLVVPTTAPLQAGDSVTAAFGAHTLGTQQATPALAPFAITGAMIAAERGNTVTCTYTVTRSNTPLPVSLPLSVFVTVAGEPWDVEFDFDGEPARQISSRMQGAQLQFPNVFSFMFDRNDLPIAEQFIGVERYIGGGIDDYYKGDVLWIGHRTIDTLVDKVVLCDLFRDWSEVRFAISSMDDPVTVSFQDRSRRLIGDIKTLNAHGGRGQYAEVRNDVIDTRKVGWIEIHCPDTIRLDFFKLKR